jgi:2-octaprenyl-6-methoxyphenol hydroxylase
VSKASEVIIVGGGCLGLTMGLALKNLNFDVKVLERQKYEPAQLSRLIAVNYKSCEFLKEHILHDAEFQASSQQINHILVQEGKSQLNFNPQDLGYDYFGYMIEEHKLYGLLHSEAERLGIIEHATMSHFEVSTDDVRMEVGGEQLTCQLLIACDGRQSKIRTALKIPVEEEKYQQIAIVANVTHPQPHNGLAVEIFLPNGPFAILPKQGGTSSSIVWTERADFKTLIENLPHPELEGLFKERFGHYFGGMTLQGKVRCYTLRLIHALEYYSARCVLVGDAAHSIHPIAGQGMNLGIRDVMLLSSLLKRQKDCGLDLASPLMLQEYDKERRQDAKKMIEATSFLNYIFTTTFPGAKTLRNIALRGMNYTHNIRKHCMKYAMGLLASIPSF